MLKRYFQMDTRIVLGVIILIELAFNFIIQKYALNEEVMYNSLLNELSTEDIDRTVALTRSYAWLNYLWAPINVLMQIFLISICILIGTLLLRYEIRFKEIFNVVAKAYAIFAVSRLILIGAYLYFGVNQLSDLDYVTSVSLYAIVKNPTLPEWATLLLKTINLYQVIFILLLAAGLNLLQHRGLKRWIPLVLGTYGTGLAIYVAIFIFLIFL